MTPLVKATRNETVTDSQKSAASGQSENSEDSAEPAEIVAVTETETDRRIHDLSALAGASCLAENNPSARGNWHMRLRVRTMGSTCDPFHNVNLDAASEKASVYALDEVYPVPAGRPLLKLEKHVTNAE